MANCTCDMHVVHKSQRLGQDEIWKISWKRHTNSSKMWRAFFECHFLMPYLADEICSTLKIIAQRFFVNLWFRKKNTKDERHGFQKYRQSPHTFGHWHKYRSKIQASHSRKFVKSCVGGLTVLTTTLINKFPLQCLVVRDARCFSPAKIKEPEASIKEQQNNRREFSMKLTKPSMTSSG